MAQHNIMPKRARAEASLELFTVFALAPAPSATRELLETTLHTSKFMNATRDDRRDRGRRRGIPFRSSSLQPAYCAPRYSASDLDRACPALLICAEHTSLTLFVATQFVACCCRSPRERGRQGHRSLSPLRRSVDLGRVSSRARLLDDDHRCPSTSVGGCSLISSSTSTPHLTGSCSESKKDRNEATAFEKSAARHRSHRCARTSHTRTL